MKLNLSRGRAIRSVTGLIGIVLAVSACGGGPGDVDDLADALSRGEAFSADEARCIAEGVFDRYGEDEEAISLISAANDFEALNSETGGVGGFEDFFDDTADACSNS